MLQRQDGRCDPRGLRKSEPGGSVLDDVLDLRQPRQRLDPRLRLAGFTGLVAEPIDERLDMCPLRRDTLYRTRLLQRFFGSDADKLVKAAGRQRQFSSVKMRDRLDRP